MDYLREGVHLRAMAQKDPLVEYTAEGHVMFEELNAAIREEVVLQLFHMQVTIEDAEALQEAQEAQAVNGSNLSYQHDSVAGAQAIGAAAAAAGELFGDGDGTGGPDGEPLAVQRVVSEHEKLGRNDPCWCGSGKKFKKCHGA
jgi:preprotein translocase subunit SecA